jgi:guanylate kinase
MSSLPKMLILSSPSGAGKTTLARLLRERFPICQVSISHTTRKPRLGEEDGREYHFINDAQFDEMVTAGEFAEWAPVHTSRYGTSKAEVARILGQGNSILFDIDWQGTEQLLATYSAAVGVFVLPPSMDELARRLRGRKTDDEAEIRVRLANAREELRHFNLYHHLIRNDDLDAAFADLAAVALGQTPPRALPTVQDVNQLIEEVVS